MARERFALGTLGEVVGVVNGIGADHIHGNFTERSKHNWQTSRRGRHPRGTRRLCGSR
jgi:hypothetical protein